MLHTKDKSRSKQRFYGTLKIQVVYNWLKPFTLYSVFVSTQQRKHVCPHFILLGVIDGTTSMRN